jgi:hypothetical protein
MCIKTQQSNNEDEAERLDNPAEPSASTPCLPLAPWLQNLIATGEVPE